MPTFPGTESFGYRTAKVQTATPDTRGTTAGLQSLENLGKIGADIAIEVDRNQRMLKSSQLTTRASMELEEYVFNMKTDRDYGTQHDRYTQFAKDLDKRYRKEFEGDSRGYSIFKNNFTELAFKRGFDIRSQALNGQMDVQKGELAINMSQLAELAVSGDEEQRDSIKQKAADLLSESYHGGVIDYEEAAKIHMDFKDNMASAKARYDILTDPDQAADDLLAGKYEMSEERAMMWLEKANSASGAKQRARFAAEDRARRDQERHDSQVAEDTAKSGDQLLFTGEMTAEWLEDNREALNESDYRYFYKSMRTGSEGFTDINIYSSLRQRASEGEDVREDARSYLHKGMLKLTDYEKLINRSEQNTGASSVPNWFKRGEQYLGRTFQVSDLNDDDAAPQRLANALDDWSQWALDNPQASNEDARKAYKEIEKSYALDAYVVENIDTMPLPKFAVGDRYSLNLEATGKATAEAFQRGEISKNEAAAQMREIKRWREAMKGLTDANQ